METPCYDKLTKLELKELLERKILEARIAENYAMIAEANKRIKDSQKDTPQLHSYIPYYPWVNPCTDKITSPIEYPIITCADGNTGQCDPQPNN